MKILLKFLLAICTALIPSSALAQTNENEIIWIGNGVAGTTPDVKPYLGHYNRIHLILYQSPEGKYFVADNDTVRLTKFVANPEYSQGNTNLTKGHTHIIESTKYGNIYVSPDLNGNPMDYYTEAKKRELGIVYPVIAKPHSLKNGEWVSGNGENLRIVLYRKGETDDYEAEYKGKRYPVCPSEHPRTFIKDNLDYFYIVVGKVRYIFTFNKIQ